MAATLAAIACPSLPAEAKDRQAAIDISAAGLPEAIAELSRQAGVSIGAEGILPHLRVTPLHGRMSVAEALARLLAGSGYVARQVGSSAWRIERRAAPPAIPDMQTASAPPEIPLADVEQIVVTAAKRSRWLDDLPMAISVVQLDRSRRHDPRGDTAAIAGEIEGLSLTALGPGRNRMFVRGVADSPFNGESQTTVAVMLDDARLTYAAPDPDVRLVDVDRVEVLKGPQGSLYGTGALGGIYQIVTRRADLDEASLDVAAGGEAMRHARPGVSGTAVANLPLERGRAALRLVGYSADEAGWIDTGGRSNSNTDKVLGARAGLGFDAGAGWRVDLTAFAQWLESRDSGYVYRPHARSRPAQLAEPHDNDLRHLSLRVGREAGAVDFVLSTAVTWHEVGDRYDATRGAESFGLPLPRLLGEDRHYRVWDNEARASGHWGRMDWLLGLSHVEARQSALTVLSGSASPASLTLDDDRRTITDSAAFGEVTIPLTDQLKLTPGARLFHSVMKETRALPQGPAAIEKRRSGVTPSAALAWQPRLGRLIFLRYGSAFRQGGVDITASGAVERLDGDELATIEAGWREALPGGGQLSLGAYYSWWENLQSDQLLANGLTETGNSGNAQIVGAELALTQPLRAGWHLQAGGEVTRARLVRNALGFELDDRSLPVVPRYVLRGGLTHEFRLGKGTASLGLHLRWLGPARLSFDPALDRRMGRVLESRLEGHFALDRLELALSIDNPLDRSSDTFAFGNPLRFAATHQYTPQQPLSASLSLLRHF